MAGFRRAQLRGSDELFRPTQAEAERNREPVSQVNPTGSPPISRMPPPSAGGRLLRLSDEEIQTIADALQRLKFPGQQKTPPKPAVEEFERLEELRQKLLSVL
ncbi:MAG: hypothetical protein E6J14_04475 [Chloroflexi bacterium]|nr:MAG: hypothetical protein E6J14_04475 [Chloroflexota bacterium]